MANKINQEPTASGLLPTDSVLVWETAQTPHTRHAPITQVLQSMSSLPARFTTITVGGVQLVPGPSQAQFDTLNTSATANANAIPSIASRISALQARVAALEGGTPLITIGNIADQSVNTVFPVSGNLSGFASVPVLQYQDNAGAWLSLPTGSPVFQTNYSFSHPGVATATASMTVSVRNSAAPTQFATSNNFAIVAQGANVPGAPTNLSLISAANQSLTVGFVAPVVTQTLQQTISVTTPPNMAFNTAFSVSGTLGNYTVAPSLEYQDDAGSWFAANATINLPSFTFSHFGMPSGAHTVSVRDAAQTSIVGTSGTYNVSAAPPATITITSTNVDQVPNPSGNAINISGTMSGYTSPPQLQWTINEFGSATVWNSIPFTGSTTSFSVPGILLFAPDIYSISVRDANTLLTTTSPDFTITYGTVSGGAVATAGHSGNPLGRSINILILGDGFSSSEDSAFQSAVANLANAFSTQAPYSSFASKINVYSVLVHSTNSGVSGSIENPGTVNTYFHMVCSGSGDTGVGVTNRNLMLSVANKYLPQYTAIYMLGNTHNASGTAVSNAIGLGTLGPNTTDQFHTFLHELGHAIYGLSDEYTLQGSGPGVGGTNWPGGTIFGPFGAGSAVNITDTIAHESSIWQGLNTSPPFLLANSNCTNGSNNSTNTSVIGRFEGAGYYNCGLYRPQGDCKMRTTNSPFCAVCNGKISQYLTAL